MALITGLRRWVSLAAALALAVTAAGLVVALTAAGSAGSAGREMSQRLLPAAAAAGLLLGDYNQQQTLLRNYVTTGAPAALRQFRQAAVPIPRQQAEVARLVGGYPLLPGLVATAGAAQQAWLAWVAGPQLTAAGRGDFRSARAMQAAIPFTRPYVFAVRAPMTQLQAQITSLQTRVTTRLVSAQGRVLFALVAMCLVVALIAVGGVLAVRRWLLAPFAALRTAAESVAAGHYDTRVPAVGPAELANLGRSTELMRTRLLATLGEAQRAEERFRGLFESSPDATLTVAANGTIGMVNAQAERMFGYSADEMVGQPVEMLVPAAARGAHPRRRAGYFADPQPRPMGGGLDLSAVRKDGTQFRVEISLSALPGESGVVATATIRDISRRLIAQAEGERLRAEAEHARVERRLQQSERLESLGQLVGGVAHDFNNMLNVITGYADLVTEQVTSLAGEDPRMDAVLADVEQVRVAAEGAVRLTRQLLIFARRDVMHPEVLDVNSIIGGVGQLLQRTLGEHIRLTVTADPGLWPVMADRGQLEQVLVNLAINASDAMPGGGKITIDTGNIVADQAYAASRPGMRPGSFVRLRVSDTGTGMSRQVLARVFEPFYSTKARGRGTGLGLATVYGIVTQAGGYVQIYSEPGFGTTVTVMLPASPAAAGPIAGPPAAAPARGRGETILLVEDEPSLWQLASRILTRSGYQVCPAASPADALREASDLRQPIDLLLTDVVMPDMLGNEVAARVRASRPGLPVLYMSGYAQTVLDAQGALDAHVDLLEKPFSEITVLSRVRQAIDSRKQGTPARAGR